jgi:DeoR/GlpR family transcriptional regulator of sugar metabolism
MTQPKQGDERITRKTAQRSELILQELLRAGSLSVEDLAQRLGVDASTIRRDLMRLEQRQLLKRVHGGAIQIDPLAYNTYGDDLTFQRSMQQHVEEQTRIALAATRLIEPGDSIALSPGATTTYMARAIRHMPIARLTVVTNALNIAMELAGLRNVTLTLVGGILLSDFFATVGPMAEHNLHELYTSKAFISAHGLSVEHGLTGPNQLEALTYRAMMQRARQTIVLADQSKIGHVALYRIAPATAMQTLITGGAAPPEAIEELERLGIGVQRV